jgi:UrcA family protein
MTYAKLSFAAAFAAGALIATAASAQEDAMYVRLGGYDLSSEQGAKQVMKRIETAAEQFCGVVNPREMARVALQHKCVVTMTGKAVAKLNAPLVTALQARRHPATVEVAFGQP